MLMPPDEENINHRMRALRDFCNGFIGSLYSMPPDEAISEILIDLRSIASVTDEMEENEENESDLFELVEFVRASVFFIFLRPCKRNENTCLDCGSKVFYSPTFLRKAVF